jgi:NTE family protein
MRAYAIYAGGGVKGAALAGCLKAAEDHGVKFIGHGGTSAGSIVALLAAVGYTGGELERMLVQEVDFCSLLEDEGQKKLKYVQMKVEEISSMLKSGGWLRKLYAVNIVVPHVLKKWGPGLGLDHGSNLKQFLLDKIQAKIPNLKGHVDITFQHLHAANCLPVKIVASDISARRPALFPLEHTKYGDSVVEAVRASTCYPFAFVPVFLNGQRLVDGGLSSNLPVFLFAEEYRKSSIPALAFDLCAPPGEAGESYDFVQYLNDLFTTALEASDHLLRQVLRGVYYVPVQTPPCIKTLDFGLSQDHRKRLFDAGYRASAEYLSKLEPLKRTRMAGEDLQKQLQAEFGQPQLFTSVLEALAREVERRTKAQNVRAHIMLPTGREEPTRIVTYYYGMDHDTDRDLELPETAGCSGQAWSQRKPAFADLAKAAKDPQPWGMTRDQHNRVPKNRKAMLSVPIHSPLKEGEQHNPPLPVGTLSVDSITPLDETGWIEYTTHGLLACKDVVTIMMKWAYILNGLLTLRGGGP